MDAYRIFNPSTAQQERDDAIAESAVQRAHEWMEDEEVVQSHLASGDFKCNSQLAELIVAGYRAKRGPERNRIFESLGSLLVIELQYSLEAEAEKQIREEASRG